MRNITLVTLFSLAVAATLPAQASQADRQSDGFDGTHTQAAPFSGQIAVRGQEHGLPAISDLGSRQTIHGKHADAQPEPFQGNFVVRGQVRHDASPEQHTGS